MVVETSPPDDAGTSPNPRPRSVHDEDSGAIPRGVHAIRARVKRARESVQHASNGTANYIKNEPGKAMLIAFALGAALVAVMSLVARSRSEE